MVSGTNDSFDAFAADEWEALVRMARVLTGDWHTAQDLAQETLARMWRAWPKLRDHSAALAYARTTMVRLHLREQRRLWHRKEVTTPAEQLPILVADESDLPDPTLAAALAYLPPRQRVVIVLRFYLDLSVTECAQVMGGHEGTVKRQTARGLAALQHLLSETHAIQEGT